MNNRHPSSPILLTAAFAFVVSPLLSQAEPGVPNDSTATNTAPAAAPAAAPAFPSTPSTPAATNLPATTPTTGSTPSVNPSTYTVVAGDSLWLVAHKFDTSIKALKKLNHLTKKTLQPGQVLKIPPPKGTKSTTPPTPAVKPNASSPSTRLPSHHKVYAKAQPVQDFDIPASTFASCPVPQPTPEDDAPASSTSAQDTTPTSAPIAKLVSPEELTAESTPKSLAPVEATAPAPAAATSHYSAQTDQDDATGLANSAPATFSTSSSKFASRTSSSGDNSGSNSFTSAPSTDWQSRFLQTSRELADRGIEYDEDWRPPGESHAWAMDCSNTARYLYKVTTGIELPRTASDQYYYLHLQNKAWDVPQTSTGFADCSYLRENLKPGDLLFWENTYRPERQPPITHVMVFLGTNERNEWIMAGSQTSRGGEHNRRNGGPDIYVFDPNKPCGGYSTWLGLVHHQGRFCAFGRPLEADRSKLAVATND